MVMQNCIRSDMYTAEDLTTDRVYQFRVAATTVHWTGSLSERDTVVAINLPSGSGGLIGWR